MKRKKIAIVGSGISGLSCAWKLSEKFDVDLYERQGRFGGHSNTVQINEKGKLIDVDTGFIVFNEHNYPNLCKFFQSIGVDSYESDMSFGVSILRDNLEYSGTNLFSVFAQNKNLLNFKFIRMLVEIIKFNNSVKDDKLNFKNYTIGEYLEKKQYSNYFKFNHLFPMAASIWSTELKDIKNYPFEKFVSFFDNHGLLKIVNRPKWRTVKGGSKNYISKVLDNKKIKSYLNAKVKVKKRSGMIYLDVNGALKKYNHLVIAAHSDQVGSIINLDQRERDIFKDIKYKKNIVYLHNDSALMPKIGKVWSSWNYIEQEKKSNRLTVTYWMNNLQNLQTKTNIFVSLNPFKKPDVKKTYKVIEYAHPNFDFKTFEKQKEIDNIQGKLNTWFCGAYLGYGFHEDGISSSLKVAKKIYDVEKENFRPL